jgi:hypothetical protein
MLARSVLRHQTIFLLVFMEHVFLSVDNVEVVWELFLLISYVDVPANFLSFGVFVCPASSFPVVTLFSPSFPCPIQYNVLHATGTASLLLPIVSSKAGITSALKTPRF